MSLLLIPLSFLISACTPPIPPEVLASYAEQEVLCANGSVIVKGSENTSSVIQAGIDLYLTLLRTYKLINDFSLIQNIL